MVRGDIGGVAKVGPEGFVAMGWSPLGWRQGSQQGGCCNDSSERTWDLDNVIIQGGGGWRHVLKIEPRGRGDGLNKRIRMPRVLFGDAE